MATGESPFPQQSGRETRLARTEKSPVTWRIMLWQLRETHDVPGPDLRPRRQRRRPIEAAERIVLPPNRFHIHLHEDGMQQTELQSKLQSPALPAGQKQRVLPAHRPARRSRLENGLNGGEILHRLFHMRLFGDQTVRRLQKHKLLFEGTPAAALEKRAQNAMQRR